MGYVKDGAVLLQLNGGGSPHPVPTEQSVQTHSQIFIVKGLATRFSDLFPQVIQMAQSKGLPGCPIQTVLLPYHQNITYFSTLQPERDYTDQQWLTYHNLTKSAYDSAVLNGRVYKNLTKVSIAQSLRKPLVRQTVLDQVMSSVPRDAVKTKLKTRETKLQVLLMNWTPYHDPKHPSTHATCASVLDNTRTDWQQGRNLIAGFKRQMRMEFIVSDTENCRLCEEGLGNNLNNPYNPDNPDNPDNRDNPRHERGVSGQW